jgi:hypothetical protein
MTGSYVIGPQMMETQTIDTRLMEIRMLDTATIGPR